MGNGVYPTTTTPLAAYLITEGFDLLDANFSDPSSIVWLFKNDSTEIDSAVRAYHSGEATGNICTFFNNYGKLLKRIHRGF